MYCERSKERWKKIYNERWSDQNEHKDKHKFSPKKAKNCCIQALRHTYKYQKNNFFHKQRKSFKKEKYLNLTNFNNRNAINKTRFLSGNLTIYTTKWYNLQEYMKSCKIYNRNETENKNIRKKALNDRTLHKKCSFPLRIYWGNL